MNVRVVAVKENIQIEAQILDGRKYKNALPSPTDGWRFNFRKHSAKIRFQTYVLVCDDTPSVIEGCLIFEIKDKVEPYMAYVEIAPHNKGRNRKKDNVAGCLIAFACRLSFIHGEGHFKGWLAFDVLESTKADEAKLMAVYSKKYSALRYGDTTLMVIPPQGGGRLIAEYLNI